MELEALVGELGGGVIGNAFSAMEAADEECKAAGNPHGLFPLLRPPYFMLGKHPELIRHHMRELARRYERGEDTTLATDAELLCGLSEASLKAPLNRLDAGIALALAEDIFHRSFDADRHESFPGEREERLTEARWKMRQGWRR